MAATARAAYLVAPRTIELRREPIPVPGPGAVVVAVRAALTDGTDLKAWRRGHREMPFPSRFGHEFAGDVLAVGPALTTFAPGDRMATVHSAPDGTCFWCLRGEEELCATVMTTKLLGAYAEYVLVPAHVVARNAFVMPAGMGYERAAFLEPLACVVHAQRRLGARPGDVVAIIGDGGFGMLHALVAQATGLRPVLIGRRPERAALARELGIADVLDARSDDVRAELDARTAGRGADAAIEATGSAEVWEAAPALVRRGGTVSLFGGLPAGTRVGYDAARLHYDEVTLQGPFHFTPAAVRVAFELLSLAALPIERLIGARFALGDIAAAFEALDGGTHLKLVIVP